MLLAHTMIIRKPVVDVVPLLIGWTVGMLLITRFPLFRKQDIIISPDHVEGPQRQGIFIRRKNVLLSDVDLSTSRLPSITKSGYLLIKDGSKIILAGFYFDRTQGKNIFREIENRLTKT